MARADTTTDKIRTAMAELGTADAATIAEAAQVAYSTTTRKLRTWAQDGDVTRLEQPGATSTWSLNDPSTAQDNPPSDSAQPTDADADADAADQNTDRADTQAGETPAAETGGVERPAPRARRGKGDIGRALLSIMQRDPDTAHTVESASKIIDRRDPQGRKTSRGAVSNAMHKLAADGVLIQTTERPATFKAT